MALMASTFFSSGMPATSDGSRIPRSSWELTKSLPLGMSRMHISLGVLSLNYHCRQRLWRGHALRTYMIPGRNLLFPCQNGPLPVSPVWATTYTRSCPSNVPMHRSRCWLA
jgi:hypothetical protein